MATTSIKSNVTRGTITLSSPFALRSWGHATYVRQGSLLIVNITAFYATEAVSANTPICTLPFTVKNWQGQVLYSTQGERMLVFSYDGNQAIYAESAVTSTGDYWLQMVIDTY